MSMLRRKDEVIDRPIGVLASVIGSVFAFLSLVIGTLATYEFCLCIACSVMAGLNPTTAVPDWTCGQYISGVESGFLGLCAMACFLLATWLLQKMWWHDKFWRRAGFVGIAVLLLLLCFTRVRPEKPVFNDNFELTN